MSISTYMGKPGQGMQLRSLSVAPDTARNRAQWLSIADFLVRQNFREVMKARMRAEAAGVAGATPVASAAQGATRSIPVGNHGETFVTGVGA